MAFTYILRCLDGTLYTGITTDVKRRFLTHLARGKASARYTRSHPVKEICAVWEAESYSLAARLEYRLKRLSKKDKERLILMPELLFTYFPMLSSDRYRYVWEEYQIKEGEKEDMLPFSQSDKAYAKINLDLYVTERRSDGFHNISSLMAELSLFDTVTLSVLPSDTLTAVTETRGAVLPGDERNLATRAALLFCRRRGITASISVSIEKRIPMGAGLAGGSSDAAAVLRLLKSAFPAAYSEEELSQIASEIGSDVNYCLHGGISRCTGRGEKLRSLSLPVALPVLLVLPKTTVSTPAAYRRLDECFPDYSAEALRALTDGGKMDAAIESGDLSQIAALTYNVFESVTEGITPLLERLEHLGAICARMSGSGPSVYAVFADQTALYRAEKEFSGDAILAYVKSTKERIS